MKDLAVRLAALDADAGAALRVIAYFDGLTEARAGLQTIVRGAAVLAGCPARLVDDERRVRLRVTPDGASVPSGAEADKAWMRTAVGSSSAVLLLERAGEPGPVDAMILERASGALRAVLDRTRGRAPAADPALVELLVDASAPLDVREKAARAMHLPAGPIRAVARETGPALLPEGAPPPAGRAGIGPAVAVADLPASWAAARVALRFAAEGTDDDPGDSVVHHADLGALVLLASAPVDVPDLRALDHAVAAAPWALTTLHAFADTPSLRAAAAALRLHHSTMQDRVTAAEHLLGWSLRDPRGRLRLDLALALRRLRRHPE
jgi:hypothetical protein